MPHPTPLVGREDSHLGEQSFAAHSLEGLVLANFKSFAGRHYLPIRPITLVFGPNSSGKSAILLALLLASRILALSSRAPRQDALIDLTALDLELGSFSRAVYAHDKAREIELTPLWTVGRPSTWERRKRRWPLRDHVGRGGRCVGVGWVLGDAGRNWAEMISRPVYIGSAHSPAAIVSLAPPEARSDRQSVGSSPWVREIDEVVVSRHHGYLREHVVPRALEWVQAVRESIDEWEASCMEMEYDQEEPNEEDYLYIPDVVDAVPDAVDSSNQAREIVVSVRTLILRWVSANAPIRVPMNELEIQGEAGIARVILDGIRRNLEELSADDLVNLVSRDANPAGTISPRKISGTENYIPDADYLSLFLRLAHDPQVGHVDAYRETGAVPYVGGLVPDFVAVPQVIDSASREALESMVRVRPVRELPPRLVDTEFLPRAVDPSLDYLTWMTSDPRNLQRLNELLDRFCLGYRVEAHRLAGPSGEEAYHMRLLDTVTGIPAAIADVGYGIGQVLPVLVACLGVENRIVCMEQPELHLHPRLQSELAEAFVVAASHKNTVIVETHSEHVLMRLQNLIRRGSVSADDVCVLSVSKNAQGSRVSRLRLSDEGELLDPWPAGFFQESFNELFGSMISPPARDE
jgi:AAA ATPase domain